MNEVPTIGSTQDGASKIEPVVLRFFLLVWQDIGIPARDMIPFLVGGVILSAVVLVSGAALGFFACWIMGRDFFENDGLKVGCLLLVLIWMLCVFLDYVIQTWRRAVAQNIK